jgi:hypothetical protein
VKEVRPWTVPVVRVVLVILAVGAVTGGGGEPGVASWLLAIGAGAVLLVGAQQLGRDGRTSYWTAVVAVLVFLLISWAGAATGDLDVNVLTFVVPAAALVLLLHPLTRDAFSSDSP